MKFLKANQLILYIFVSVILCSCSSTVPMSSFEECMAAGGIMLKSYPAQCLRDGIAYKKEQKI